MEQVPLSNLYARTLVLRGAFPTSEAAMRARVALQRIAEKAEKPLTQIETNDPVALYLETIPEESRPVKWRDDLTNLRHLPLAPVVPTDMAERIWRQEAHLDDAITAIALQDWGAERARITGALRRYAQIRDKRPEQVPAVERSISDHLRSLSGADFGIAPGSYPTLRSRILRAVRLVDPKGRCRFTSRNLTGEWRALTDKVRSENRLRGDLAKIWGLITYCFQRGVEPQDVDDAVIQDFQKHLEVLQANDTFDTVRAAVYSWERMQRLVPGWPQARISRLYRAKSQTPQRFIELPDKVQELWNSYAEATGRNIKGLKASELVCGDPDDPFSDLDGDLAVYDSACRYAPATLQRQRSSWTRCAVIHKALHGDYPRKLSDVTARGILTEAVRQYQPQDTGKGTAPAKSGVLKNLLNDAISWSRFDGCSPGHIELLEHMRDRVDPHLVARSRTHQGEIKRQYSNRRMGERHKERLRQFSNPLNIVAWYELPDLLARKAGDRLDRFPDDPVAMKMAMIAVVHLILRCAPLRRANLVGLTISGDNPQVYMPRFRSGQGRISIPAQLVKNNRDLTVELDEQTQSIVRWWLKDIRPAFMKRVGSNPENPYLFPAAGDTHRRGEKLSEDFSGINKRHGQISLNLHCCRHLTAKLVLDLDPSQMSLVQHLLGHKSIATTESYYAEVNDLIAQREWHRILERTMKQTRKQVSRRAA